MNHTATLGPAAQLRLPCSDHCFLLSSRKYHDVRGANVAFRRRARLQNNQLGFSEVTFQKIIRHTSLLGGCKFRKKLGLHRQNQRGAIRSSQRLTRKNIRRSGLSTRTRATASLVPAPAPRRQIPLCHPLTEHRALLPAFRNALAT
jgi:hypothetical protein